MARSKVSNEDKNAMQPQPDTSLQKLPRAVL